MQKTRCHAGAGCKRGHFLWLAPIANALDKLFSDTLMSAKEPHMDVYSKQRTYILAYICWSVLGTIRR